MKLQPVESTNVFATAHDGDTMHVMYLNGGLYAYAPTTAADHQKLREAHSIGAAINRLQKTVTGIKVELPKLDWTGENDDMGNTTWEAASPYHEDGHPFMWRIKPRLGDNKVEFYECHDLELMDEESPQGWPTIEVAKAMIEQKHAEIMEAEGIQESPKPTKDKSLCESCAPDDGPCELQHHGIVAIGGSCNRYKEVTPL